MISYIKWTIKNLDLNSVIILTSSWIWYEILINELIYSKIFDQNETEMFLYHSITENWQNLFWFISLDDRNLFKELIKISWVWWKVAQTILSLWNQKLIKAVLEDDKSTLESIKWVWKKMAEKIILELKDKKFSIEIPQTISTKLPSNLNNSLQKEIITTLTNMWYQQKDIEKSLLDLPKDFSSLDQIIPYLIKNL